VGAPYLPKPASTVSSIGLNLATRRLRMIQSQNGSIFFQPAAYATWRTVPVRDPLVAAPRRIERQA